MNPRVKIVADTLLETAQTMLTSDETVPPMMGIVYRQTGRATLLVIRDFEGETDFHLAVAEMVMLGKADEALGVALVVDAWAQEATEVPGEEDPTALSSLMVVTVQAGGTRPRVLEQPYSRLDDGTVEFHDQIQRDRAVAGPMVEVMVAAMSRHSGPVAPDTTGAVRQWLVELGHEIFEKT